MKILIVGAGIAGLAACHFLEKDHEITIIDNAPRFDNIGFAIFLWPSGLEILDKIGIGKKIRQKGQAVFDNVYISSFIPPNINLHNCLKDI